MPGPLWQSGCGRLLIWLAFSLWSTFLRAQTTSLPQPELITDRQGLPQGFVAGIVQDQQGFIWMATRDGLCRYDGHQFKVFHTQPDGGSALSFSDLSTLQLDYQGQIWITSEQSGQIARFDPRTEVFTNFSRRIFPRQALDRFHNKHCYLDRKNRLWISIAGKVAAGSGLVCFSVNTGQFRWFRHQAGQPHSLASNTIRSILEDKNGRIWLATDAGLDQFEESTGHFRHFRPQSSTPLSLPELDLYSLYLRPTGEILAGSANYVIRFNPQTTQARSYRLPARGETGWGSRFATDSRGVVYFDQRDRLFRFTDTAGPELLTRLTAQTGFCYSLFIDRSDVLWLGTDGSGVRKYDLSTGGFQTARYQTNFQTDLLTNWLNVPLSQALATRLADPYMFRYTLDQQGGLWANVGTSTIYHINPGTHQSETIHFPFHFVQTISPMTIDRQGRVWVLCLYQLWGYDPAKRQWIKADYDIGFDLTPDIVQMVADEQAFWLATNSRGLFRLDRRTGKLRQYSYQPNQPTSLSNNTLFCLSTDPTDANRLWIGTFGSGLCAFDKQSGQCRRITEQEGLPNNVIYSALPDQHGHLWIGTNKGLCRMNRQNFKISIFTIDDGLLANEFNRFHYVYLPGPVRRSDGAVNDQIIMGGVDGITAFQPGQLHDDFFQPTSELTELRINNQLVKPGAGSPLLHPFNAVRELNLPYNQNFLAVQFAALQYNRPGKNRYRYQLAGIDRGWVETPQPQAIYTAISPGRYTLSVNASNTSGVWSPTVRQLTIVIHPPWWRSWWAYVFYGLFVVGSIWYGIRLRLNQLQLQQTIALRQQEARQLRELDAMKSRFFTNVTHDFRTPLTLILSPMSGLLQDLTGTRYEKRLDSIRRNANQLLSLINQLLDFSRLEAQALTLHESRGELGEFVEKTIGLFRQEAQTKDIALTFQKSVTGDYWFDADKLERILSNLLGNALKFTPPGGQITISLQAGHPIELVVSDTGVGIPPEKLPLIFDRFYQGSAIAWSAIAWSAIAVDQVDANPSSDVTPVQTGTGIGLSLVKELVQLQQGQIIAESEPGVGTTFRVSLPYQSANETIAVPEPAAPSAGPITTSVVMDPTGQQLHLLLVEDNPELADFIADSLPAGYRISRATNGAEGLALALDESPDLVISDVMMPIMDGYTFCQKLKEDERTNHIPVILLTARVTLDNRLEGLGRGADDYLTKPFHVAELNLRVQNLLERQRRLSERIRKELSHPTTSEKNPVPLDPFLEKLYLILEGKLDDTTFGVEELADQVNMSRVHLHRKLKALTGLPAGDVIRNYRLKRAAQFLLQGFNSSETADQVGFDSPQYFAKCFREMYQMTPREFAQKTEKPS
jgi:signal transduction histidine kinase/ligand-binding sensor domain-containing protein/CheY-like chemotaxis protein